MARAKRKAIPANEKGDRQFTTKVIGADTVSESGKLYPASMPGDSKLLEDEEKKKEEQEEIVSKSIFVPITKVDLEQRTVTGVVLQPEITDAQGDVMDADVIAKAAHDFLAKYNKATKMGLMHKVFRSDFELYESYTAPQDLVLGDKLVKAGSWIMMTKILKDKIWKKVKEGTLTGYSIGGSAKVKKVEIVDGE